jgi:hypothetical protein
MAGHWKQHELWDGTYNFEDLVDWHEAMRIKTANEALIRQYEDSHREG